MKNALWIYVAALMAAGCGSEAPPDVEPSETVAIVPEGASLEKVFTRSLPISGGLTEGPAVGPDRRIYFSDIPFGDDKGKIMRFDPRTGETDVFAEDSGKSNGLTFSSDGHLIAAEGADQGGRQISRWNVETGEKTTLADNYDGKRFNAPNDLTLDTKGRVYFSDPRYLGAEQRELEHMAVYRVDADGTVVELTHDVEKPNGVALSPDGKTFYLADHNNGSERITDPDAPKGEHGNMKVYSFSLGDDGLINGPRKTIVDFGDQAGCDGMTVDVEGNIYLTSRGLKRPGVMIINPDGEEVGFISTGPENQTDPDNPEGLPSNVEFGIGDEANVLYVTVDLSLYRIKLGVTGYHPY